MKPQVIRSAVTELKLFELKTLATGDSAEENVELNECPPSNHLELFVSFSFKRKRKRTSINTRKKLPISHSLNKDIRSLYQSANWTNQHWSFIFIPVIRVLLCSTV